MSSPLTTAADSAPLSGSTALAGRRWNRKWWWITVLVLVVAGWGVGQWWNSRSPVATQDIPAALVSGTKTPELLPDRFRVAFWNMHRGRTPAGREDLPAAAAALREFDLIGLAEISRPMDWRKIFSNTSHTTARDQAGRLGALLERPALFAPVEEGIAGSGFGLGVLSRTGWSGGRSSPLPYQAGNGYRGWVHLELQARQGMVHCLITHLDRKEQDRFAQIDLLSREFLRLPPPVILMGDFNAKRTEPRLQKLAAEPGVSDCLGKYGQGPLISRRIDWIFTRGLKCHAAGLEMQTVSDHPLAWADLEWVE